MDGGGSADVRNAFASAAAEKWRGDDGRCHLIGQLNVLAPSPSSVFPLNSCFRFYLRSFKTKQKYF